MVSTSNSIEPVCSPRISFSAETLPATRSLDFEFLSNDTHRSDSDHQMVTADELFYDGKLLPFWQMHHSETLKKLSLKTKEAVTVEQGVTQGVLVAAKDEIHRVAGNWFVDDDPSPRPPSCTILWKELLRLKKKQRASTLSPSSSSSSSSSGSLDMSSVKEDNAENKERKTNTVRKALERTKSSTMSRIRPMVNVPIWSSIVHVVAKTG